MITPSFVADCLETIEEVGIRLKEQWLNMPNTSFVRIPCLNDQSYWTEALGRIILEQLGEDQKNSLSQNKIIDSSACLQIQQKLKA